MKRENEQKFRVLQEAEECVNSMNRPNPLVEYLNKSPRLTRRELLTAGITIFAALGTIEYGLLSKDGNNTEMLLGQDPTEYFDGQLRFKYEELSIIDESGTEIPHEEIQGINNISHIRNDRYIINNPYIVHLPSLNLKRTLKVTLIKAQGESSIQSGYIPLSQLRILNLNQFGDGEFKSIQINESGQVFQNNVRLSEDAVKDFGRIEIAAEPTTNHPDNTEVV